MIKITLFLHVVGFILYLLEAYVRVSSQPTTSLGRIVEPLEMGFVFDIHLDLSYLSGAVSMFIGFLVRGSRVRKGTAKAASYGLRNSTP